MTRRNRNLTHVEQPMPFAQGLSYALAEHLDLLGRAMWIVIAVLIVPMTIIVGKVGGVPLIVDVRTLPQTQQIQQNLTQEPEGFGLFTAHGGDHEHQRQTP